MNGQTVNTLVDRKEPVGYYSIKWDGKDKNGKNVASGIYSYKLTASHFIKVRKMAFVKSLSGVEQEIPLGTRWPSSPTGS